MTSRFWRYYHTLRYLRPGQLFWRIWFRVYVPVPDRNSAPTLRKRRGRWQPVVARQPTMTGANAFVFLNRAGNLHGPADWNASEPEKLWIYNLHYFDDLNAAEAAQRREWHRDLLQRWVRENPPAHGNGWEPYPTSLRIVNWIKWALAGNALEPGVAASLAVQARWLAVRLERHLLGNHLLANAKALVFAGMYFEGKEADRWLSKGLALLDRELGEQILSDGGHFERSPMYHAIILEDLLDLINLAGSAQNGLTQHRVPGWRRTAARMLEWLRLMCHPDGKIAFFNDAAFGIAPEYDALYAYAQRLGVNPELSENIAAVRLPGGGRLTDLASSGYVRVELSGSVAILDLAKVGPDYLPGHAHADTLSFELSYTNQRIIVNSGCSTYALGPERLRQRGTPAHNTVAIDGRDSSEVWGAFRVARRARPFGRDTRVTEDGAEICCAHDGYRRLPGKPVHRRLWRFGPRGVTIRDEIDGLSANAVAHYHFHPSVAINLKGKAAVVQQRDAVIARVDVKQGSPELVESSYHPEFGVDIPSRCLQVGLQNQTSEIHILWALDAHPVSDR